MKHVKALLWNNKSVVQHVFFSINYLYHAFKSPITWYNQDSAIWLTDSLIDSIYVHLPI